MAITTTFDRSQLGDKIRVYRLAPAVGFSSKEFVSILAGIGLKKAAQSNLTRDEALAVLDYLDKHDITPTPQPVKVPGRKPGRPKKTTQTPVKPAAKKPGRKPAAAAATKPAAHTEEFTEEDKLRYRVEKNVENELNQLKEKAQRDINHRIEQGVLTEETPTAKPAAEKATPAAGPETAEEPGYTTPLFVAPSFTAPTVPTTPTPTDHTDPFEYDEDDDDRPKRRRGKRGTGRGRSNKTDDLLSDIIDDEDITDDDEDDDDFISEPLALKGSTRLEAQRRRRMEMREESRKKRHIVSEAEFLARRESVNRTMVVRERQRHDHPGLVTQVGVLEDDMLVEHFVTSDTQSSLAGNIYLGRVQNVLPAMEAAFIDIGKGRNGVLYAGEVDWRAANLGGRHRKIEQALKSGDQVLVQVAKDPIGQKGPRLTTQISLAGRYLVYVPGGKSAGISRKLPAPERKRLKAILKNVVPADGSVIIRTAAEGVPEDAIAADVNRLHSLWEQIQERTLKEKESKGTKPVTMYEEPNMLVKVVRDLFNEDFTSLVVDGTRAWNTVHAYIQSVAPDLLDRLEKFDRDAHDGQDAFEALRVDEQLKKALSRKVWLPSGGTLVIDRTEAMTVIDVNTGKFTGSGGNLEETVTKNNLEAAEEIVRQMRLRDLGGMIVVDFIDMVLPENQDLVLRRLTEALGRDRTRHQISEVTSLGLVQITRKRLGTGLLETFATECEECSGRGVLIHDDPVEHYTVPERPERRGKHGVPHQDPTRHPTVLAMGHQDESDEPEPVDDFAEEPPFRPSETSIEGLAAAVVAPSAEDYLPATYEEAVSAYEASPRRNRKVRGNSLSDVPPQKSDFEPPTPEPEPEPEPEEIVEELNEHLHVPLTTIAAEEHYILHRLLDTAARELSFAELVQGSGELEIAVVRFLALLELYKEGALHVEQDAPLGAIRVRASASAAQFVIREETADTAGTQDSHETGGAPESPESSDVNEEPVEEDYE